MKLMHWMKKENSGLATTTLELVNYEQKAGHEVEIRQPGEDTILYGGIDKADVHCVHSQLGMKAYHDGAAKVMWMHGEPLSSVGNGISMKAICELAPMMDCFIAMRREEMPIWSSIKRTYLVPKGIDLERFKPLETMPLRLEGEPAVLYVENWRGSRNPLYLCKAMELVYKKIPTARLHLVNCRDPKMKDTFQTLIKQCKWWPFIRTLMGATKDINELYNKVDMVVSGLYPLYARGIEAFGADRAFIGPGYREPNYPFTCELDPQSMADAIIACWENYDTVKYRQWAKDHHDVAETVRQSMDIYARYL